MKVDLIRIPRGVLVGDPPKRRAEWIAVYPRGVLLESADGAVVFDAIEDVAKVLTAEGRRVTVEQIRAWRSSEVQREREPCLRCRKVHLEKVGACR